MGNRFLTLNINADEIVEQIPRRSRSQFISDAIEYYAKKKGIMNKYIKNSKASKPNLSEKSTLVNEKLTSNKEEGVIEVPKIKGKIKIDNDF